MRKLHQDKYTVKDIVNTMKKISPKKTDKTPIRIGKESDGGYILLDELLKGGVAYSFGVGNTSAFERDMAKRGYINHMYDHTVPKAHAVGDQFIFNRYGVGAKDGGQLKTIETIVRENKHENYNDIILQCDIEGAEYDIFTNTPQDILKCFSQIIVEYHSLDKCILDMTNFMRGRMEHWHYQKMKDTFSVLAENFTPYHVHGNNFRGTFLIEGQQVPEVIEVSYVRNDLVKFSDEKQTFPTKLDFPNWTSKPDLQLGTFSWV